MIRGRRTIQKSSDRGAAIMLALWALFLLSAMVISWALDINTRLTISGNANRSLEATAMACSGAEVALALPTAEIKNSSLLHGNFPSNQNYQVRITGEGGRLNIARIAQAIIADPSSPSFEMLRKYLELKGVDLNERDHMLDCLLDWIDPDNLVRVNGAEDEGDYQAANGPLKNLDELKRIRGWEEFTAQPDWDADFTMSSQDGRIDINWASRNVLLALPGFSEPLVDRLMSARRGRDDVEGTEDDMQLTGPQDLVALGFSQNLLNQLASLITFNDPVLRIVSIGKSGDTTRSVRMVVYKQNNAIRLISWKEL
jgi:general secretion pathway protein K